MRSAQLLLDPAAFFVVFLGTGVQRRAEAARDHFFLGQVRKGRMQTLEPIKVIEHGLERQ